MITAFIDFNWGEITIANIIFLFAPVVAIVALWLQMRALKKQLWLQNFSEYTKRYRDIILNFPENINTAKLEDYPFVEKEQTLRHMRVYFDLCAEEFYLHEKKHIKDDLWNEWEAGMRVAFSKPAFQDAWKIISKDSQFSNKFTEFVEQTIGGLEDNANFR